MYRLPPAFVTTEKTLVGSSIPRTARKQFRLQLSELNSPDFSLEASAVQLHRKVALHLY